MPLCLNLYHEIKQQRSASRRDPLKISLYVLGAVVASFAGWYFWEAGKMAGLSRELAQKKAEFDAIEPRAKAAQKREEDLQQTFKISEKLVKRIEGRFYWAPVLAQITTLVPREVQITKFAGDCQGDAPKKCQFTVDGLSAGPDPRKVAEELRQSLVENFGKQFKNVDAKFRTLEDGTELAMLDGKKWPTASFAINVQFQSGEAAAATPPPRGSERKKSRGGATAPAPATK